MLTVLWHDRSHGPERFWGDFYIRLVEALKSRNVWFATRLRRSAVPEAARRALRRNRISDGLCVARVSGDGDEAQPPLNIRVHRPRTDVRIGRAKDIPWNGASAVELTLGAFTLLSVMKSVCILDQTLYPFDARVRRKAEALVAAGYAVDVLTLRDSSGRKHYTLNGVNVYTLPLGKKRASLPRYVFEYAAFFLWAFVRVPLMMRRRRYSVVDVNTLPDFLIFAPIVARWMGARLVLDMHEMTPEFYMSKYGMAETSWIIRLLTFVERISFNFADHVTTISDPIRELFVSRGLQRSKSTVIMNVADEKRFLAGAPACPDDSGDPDRVVMMYHGTLTRIYGLEVAIEAFALAADRMPRAELWILGFGPEEQFLKELIEARGLSDRIKMLGAIPPANIPSWLRRCDIGILPMRRDVFLDFAFPNKLAEFIITGTPVVISRLKGLRHYFSEDALAYFEPNDPADLARQMVRVYEDRGLRARLVATAREEYAPIRWDVMKQRYLELMEGLTDRRQSVVDGRQSMVESRPSVIQ